MSEKNKMLKRSHRQKDSTGQCIACNENLNIIQNLKRRKIEEKLDSPVTEPVWSAEVQGKMLVILKRLIE